jgi:hypothetical protein
MFEGRESGIFCVIVPTLLVSPVYTTVNLHELTNPLETGCGLDKLLARLPAARYVQSTNLGGKQKDPL